MEINQTRFEGLLHLKGKVFKDDRGYFFENYNESLFREHGLPVNFVQDNFSRSKKGVVRGLHLQLEPHGQLKYVRTISGNILDVAVDLRPSSPTFGEVFSTVLEGGTTNALIIPAGFAHGFAALEDSVFHYKCTGIYHPASETGIRWNDSDLGIDWMVKDPIVSEKDKKLPTFREFKDLHISGNR
jgi:dTDP-4-dehydrorhamnose 3,5-epimerase